MTAGPAAASGPARCCPAARPPRGRSRRATDGPTSSTPITCTRCSGGGRWRRPAAPARGPSCTSTTSGCRARSGSPTATAPVPQCGARNTLPGLVHRCRGPLREAGVYAAGLALQYPRLLAQAGRLVAPSRVIARLLVLHGVPLERVGVLPNFIASRSGPRRAAAEAGEYALFAGRLVEEKGADIAIGAARPRGCRSWSRDRPGRAAVTEPGEGTSTSLHGVARPGRGWRGEAASSSAARALALGGGEPIRSSRRWRRESRCSPAIAARCRRSSSQDGGRVLPAATLSVDERAGRPVGRSGAAEAAARRRWKRRVNGSARSAPRRIDGDLRWRLPPRQVSQPIREPIAATSGRRSTTPNSSFSAPSTSTSDMNGPIWRGGKLTTATTSVSSSCSRE